jgi:hypothetical protein
LEKTEYLDVRGDILEYLSRQVVGPKSGADEVLDDLPHRTYLMGTLYPQNASTAEVVETEDGDGPGGSVGEELADDPVKLANEWLPNSMGLTFYVSGTDTVECQVSAARYEAFQSGHSRRWRRIPLTGDSSEIVTLVAPPDRSRARTTSGCLGGRAALHAFWRRMPGGYLVTVSLVNTQVQSDPTLIDPDLCLHQVSFSCEPRGGQVLEYPSVDFLSTDAEEQELRLLHRHVATFAIGHGCAAQWQQSGGERSVRSVRTELLPTFTVPALVHGGEQGDAILRLTRLADDQMPVSELKAELEQFVLRYESWVASLEAVNDDIDPRLHDAKQRLLERLNRTVERLRQGVVVLVSSGELVQAFRLANLAMLMQMRHSQRDLGGSRRPRRTEPIPAVDYTDLPYAWRPFQLAFILLTLPSVASENDPDRDVVDLIWFPTGGGKTEAYLAVAAFEIFLRRLRSAGRGAGTAVITRYTLRLLTAQQFQRAATMVCAAELLRRPLAARMGDAPISIGLWVGDEAAPNRYQKALELFDEVVNDPEPGNPFQLERCPWCGTEIVPRRQESIDFYGIVATNNSFRFFCPTDDCPFHDALPIAVVDEELYRHPPTVLIATVDKFARLAWEEGGGSFFGMGRFEPPSLIIQDELHLLSGPLGTTVGIYEGAIEALAAYQGAKPKILASTATIRRAGEQIAGLFGRPVELFPPAGLDSRDSYFAKVDPTRPGRLYVGVMAQGHTAATTMISVAAALLQAPLELQLSGDVLDAYWTLIAYHNSLRELGRTVTQARDDIPKRLEAIARDHTTMRQLDDHTVVELTSNVGGKELPSILDRLSQHHDHPDAISFLASTNMLSVGVDVPRLGLMLVNGQPKTTSEYIQATSRVGRSKIPGLVVTTYSATRPRDRSHYESFVPFHAALYRRVEPTSVTPFSLPSRERALPAALVILVRHGVGLARNDEAGMFDPGNPDVRRAVEMLRERVRHVDPEETQSTSKHLDRLVAEWAHLADQAQEGGRSLYYRATTKQHASLLQDFGGPRETSWETLHSMRNVDRQCSIRVIGEDQEQK